MKISMQLSRGAPWLTAILLLCPLFAADRVQPGGGVQPAAAVVDTQALRNSLRNGSLQEQSAAFNALLAVDSHTALDLIVADYRDHKLLTRLQSLQLLDQSIAIDNQTITGILREALHDDDPLIGDFALQALTRRTQPGSEVLSSADLSGPDTQSQQLAKVRLAAIGQDHSGLLSLMQKGDAVVQSAAFEALAAINPTAALEELASELNAKASSNHLQSLELLLRTPYAGRELRTRLLRQDSESLDPMVNATAKRALAAER